MLKYIRFLIWLINKHFIFFKYPLIRQAIILEKKKLYFQAGIKYYTLKNYSKALTCFKLSKSYKHLIHTYEKLGLISEALQLADVHKYYKEGALICERSGNLTKAAYFYSYFKPLYAAKIYKRQNHFFEAGLCYLQKFQFIYAIDCFYKCSNPLHRAHGFKQIEEIATVLYFQKHYSDAFNLFIRIKDYHSALECAKKLEQDSLITSTSNLLDQQDIYLSKSLSSISTLSSITLPHYTSLAENLKYLSA